jgi:hypothetical protein
MIIQAFYLILTFGLSIQICTCSGESEPLSSPPNYPINNLNALQNSFMTFISDGILNTKLPINNIRYQSFSIIIKNLMSINPKIMVETGTARYADLSCEGDGCSTLIFGFLAKMLNAKLYSVDNDVQSRRGGRAIASKFPGHIEIVDSDSVDFLLGFDKGLIDFLYLDSQEYDNDVHVSQANYYNEIKAAYMKLSEKAVVMIDDCGVFRKGNCDLVKEFLIGEGWDALYLGYQNIFIR